MNGRRQPRRARELLRAMPYTQAACACKSFAMRMQRPAPSSCHRHLDYEAVALASSWDGGKPEMRSIANVTATLNAMDAERLQTSWQPMIRKAQRAASGQSCAIPSSKQRVAVLLVGAVRTMLEVSAEYATFFSSLRPLCASVSLFALLNIHSDSTGGWQAGASAPANASRAAIEAAIASWDLDWSKLALYGEPGASREPKGTPNIGDECPMFLSELPPGVTCKRYPWPGRPHNCGRAFVQKQFVYVYTAMAMLRRRELQRGFQFDVVLRLRPDMCPLQLTPFIHFALGRTHCASPLALGALDAIAILPRYMADVYASYWRSGPHCKQEVWAAPCDKDELFNRGLQTYMMRRAGVLYVNIQTVLREGIALRLRRPGRCEAWS